MRRNYIDNLRSLAILLLFPVHTFMIWNDFGAKFYIWMGESRLLSTLIVLINSWFMPLLFVLAGISARYALEKRTYKAFVAQRVCKLLLPFLCGMLLYVPVQSLFARKFLYDYRDGLLAHWRYFFTHLTDFSGYDGGFTPGHLWFILFLFVISMVSLPLFRFFPYDKASKKMEKLPAWGILLLFLPIWLSYYLGNIGGFSLGKDLVLYLAGYYILSNDEVLWTLERSRKWLAVLWGGSMAALAILYFQYAYYGDLWVNWVGWLSILMLLVLGKRYMNRCNRLTAYLRGASYPVYLLHQTVLVALAYYVVQNVKNSAVQVTGILFGSLVLTVLAYELIRKLPIVRKMFGMR